MKIKVEMVVTLDDSPVMKEGTDVVVYRRTIQEDAWDDDKVIPLINRMGAVALRKILEMFPTKFKGKML